MNKIIFDEFKKHHIVFNEPQTLVIQQQQK
jgi:hypothetical protein